jgi:chromosome segregation ATPase
MSVADWVSIITATSALIGPIAAALWGRQFASAEEETIKAKDAQIEALHTFQDQAVKAKQAQIEALLVVLEQTVKAKDAQIEAKEAQVDAIRQEAESLRELTPMKLRDYFVSMREQMEEYNNVLTKELQNAQAVIEKKDLEISGLRAEGQASQVEIESLATERDDLEAAVTSLRGRLHEIQETREALTLLTETRVWTVMHKTPGKVMIIGTDENEQGTLQNGVSKSLGTGT